MQAKNNPNTAISSSSTNSTATPTSSDNDESSRMVGQQQLQLSAAQRQVEVDAVRCRNYTLSYGDILSTAFSVLMRVVFVCINVRLAFSYNAAGKQEYFIWTSCCIVLPMCVTTLIHVNMCYQDGKFQRGFLKALRTLWLVCLSSIFRYGMSLVYTIKCKRAELLHDKEAQLKYYKLTLREESDVALIRLFECFMETAPQKILLIAILLAQVDKATTEQIVAILSYFGSMAWCLAAYHRSIRYAQSDKYNMSLQGLIAQLCWHFCISVSRTLCIACVACVLPLWAVIACFAHALCLGFVTFIVDRPKFAASACCNLLFCLAMGVVYVFTYISVRDAPTRLKYTLYYLLCSVENLACVYIFWLFASSELHALAVLFDLLCAVAIAFYYVGIIFMIIYYLRYHPRITARKPKSILNNN